METQSFERPEPSVSAGLCGLILHEDAGTGLRAQQALDLLSGQTGPGVQLGRRLKLRKLELFDDPAECERSAMEGAAADMIILSVRSQTGVSPRMRDWLECWLRYRQARPYVLGVMVDTSGTTRDNLTPLVAYFAGIAARAGAVLLCGFSDTPVGEQSPAAEESRVRAKPSAREAEMSEWHDGAHEWGGLNE